MTPDEMEKLGIELTRFLKSSDDIENVDLFGLARWQADREAAKDRRIEVLEGALREWMKVESEMKENNPCPDPILRANYRREALRLSGDVLGGKGNG